MSEPEFPARTAGELTLPNGDKVWICQLNSRLHEEADSKARWYAQKEARPFLKGGAEYSEVLRQVKELDAERQAMYLADKQSYTISREVTDKHAYPDRPEQDGTPEAFAKAVIEWEEACKKTDEKRQKEYESRYKAEVKKNTALTAAVRIDRCCVAFYTEQYLKALLSRKDLETFYRAVRTAEDHTVRYFKSPEEFEDSDDAVQNAIRDFFYVTLAEPKAEEIPTSPAA